MPERVRPSAVSRYEQYKSDSADLVAWLVSTAASCGYGDPKQTSKRPVPVDKLLKCAQAIAKRRPFVPIPGNIVEKTEAIIQGRRLHALDLREQGGGDDGGSSRAEKESKVEAGHRYMVDVLVRVKGVLVEARKVQRQWREENAPKRVVSCDSEVEGEAPELRGKFEGLELEEPAEMPLGAPAMVREAAKPEIALAVDPAQESCFVLFCYLHDMYDIRIWIRQLWQDYARGEISLLCATSSTEQAFACIRSTENSLRESFKKSGYGSARELYFVYCDLAVKNFQEGKDFYHEEGNRIARQHLCVAAYTLVTVAIHECKRARTAQFSDHTYEQSDEATEVSKGHPFARVLLERVVDLATHWDWKDEFAVLFSDFDGKYDGDYYMWIRSTILCQCYMDIYDIVGDPSNLVLDQLEQTVQDAKNEVDRLVQVKKKVRGPPSFLENIDSYVSALYKEGDLVELAGSASVQQTDSRDTAKMRLRKAFPVGAGDSLRLLKLHVLQVSAIVANDGWVILSLAYLYRAAHRFGLLTINWPDLDWFITLQSRTKPLFLEVAPHADPMAHGRLFKLSRGVPTDDSVKKMRSARPQNYWLQQADKLEQFDVTKNIGYDDWIYHEVLYRIADETYPAQSKHFENKYKSLELLNAFKASFIKDEPEMNFSYLSFYNSCAILLNKMATLVGKRIPARFRDDFGIDMEVTKALLDEAGAAKITGQAMMTTQLALVAKIIEKHVKEEGDKLTQAAFDRSSGTIAEDRRPKLPIA